MARSRAELHVILKAINGVKDAYFQPKTTLEYPCIVYDIDDEFVSRADNIVHFFKQRYTVKVIDRNPDSTIPGAIRDLPYSRYDRKYVIEGLHHFVYTLYF